MASLALIIRGLYLCTVMINIKIRMVSMMRVNPPSLLALEISSWSASPVAPKIGVEDKK